MTIEKLAIFSAQLRNAKNFIAFEDQAGIFCHQDGRIFVELYVGSHSCQRSKSKNLTDKSSSFHTFISLDILHHTSG
jgi:hypothetical protein